MEKSKEEIQKEKDEFLRQLIPPTGNIWGWKFSFFGLGLILFFCVWLGWLHYKKGVAPGFDDQKMEIKPLVIPQKVDTVSHE
jgi:hypothetical protein